MYKTREKKKKKNYATFILLFIYGGLYIIKQKPIKHCRQRYPKYLYIHVYRQRLSNSVIQPAYAYKIAMW